MFRTSGSTVAEFDTEAAVGGELGEVALGGGARDAELGGELGRRDGSFGGAHGFADQLRGGGGRTDSAGLGAVKDCQGGVDLILADPVIAA